MGTPKTCHGGLVAKAEAHAVTSLMPLLLKFVKNLYKTRQTDTVRICFKNFFSWEHETLVDGCLQKENFSIHLKLKGDHSVSNREIDSALSPCMDVRLSPQVRLE